MSNEYEIVVIWRDMSKNERENSGGYQNENIAYC